MWHLFFFTAVIAAVSIRSPKSAQIQASTIKLPNTVPTNDVALNNNNSIVPALVDYSFITKVSINGRNTKYIPKIRKKKYHKLLKDIKILKFKDRF